MQHNHTDTNYAACNSDSFLQSAPSNSEVQFFTADFDRGQLISGYVLSILELIRGTLSDKYWHFVEFPLQLACPKREGAHVRDKTLWQFWVNSRVDIIVMSAKLGEHCRKASLMIECQSPWHDLKEAQQRDRTKFNIIASTNIPLVYVRYADYPRILRFWSSTGGEVFYNPFTREGYLELEKFLKQHCL